MKNNKVRCNTFNNNNKNNNKKYLISVLQTYYYIQSIKYPSNKINTRTQCTGGAMLLRGSQQGALGLTKKLYFNTNSVVFEGKNF